MSPTEIRILFLTVAAKEDWGKIKEERINRISNPDFM